jgi:predicted dehydrogenase
MPFKVAVIGAGYMSEEHLKVFSKHCEIKLCGIYSRTKVNAIKLAKIYDIPLVADSIDELYKITKPDLVVICVPELQLWNVFVAATNYPWKMLVEKPIGLSLHETEKFLELTEKQNSEVYIALNRRHYTSTKTLLERLKNSSGNRVVTVIDQEDLIEARKMGQPQEVMNRWMYANSIHIIDLFSIFCRGNFDEIQNFNTNLNGSSRFVSSTIRFDSGDLGIYHGIWDAPGPWQVSVTTSDTRYELRPLEKLSIQEFPSRYSIDIQQSGTDLDLKPGLLEQSHQSILMLKNQPHTLPSLKDLLKTVSLIEGIYSE